MDAFSLIKRSFFYTYDRYDDVTLTPVFIEVKTFDDHYAYTPGPDSAINGNVLEVLIDSASQSETIRDIYLGEGTFLGNFQIKDSVNLYGGFTTSNLAEWFIDDPSRDSTLTICDGAQKGSVFAAPSNITDIAIIDGLTITNGSASYGGGLDAYGSSSRVFVNNCIITNNKTTTNDGAGTYGGTVTNCIITNNIAQGHGGGVVAM